jgi:Domain of unknown function (DUF4410)
MPNSANRVQVSGEGGTPVFLGISPGKINIVRNRVPMAPTKRDSSCHLRHVVLRPFALCSMLTVSACAGAHINASRPVLDPLPVAPLEVAIISAAPRNARTASRMDVNLKALRDGLTHQFAKQHIDARIAPMDASLREPFGNRLILIAEIANLTPGNPWTRRLIGFGFGKSRLQTHVRLLDPRGMDMADLLDFTVKSNSGAMPGVAASALNPIGLGVSGSVALVQAATSDGHEDADRTAKAITKRLVAYYRQNGWLPPA